MEGIGTMKRRKAKMKSRSRASHIRQRSTYFLTNLLTSTPAQPESPAAERTNKENGAPKTAEKAQDTVMPDTVPAASAEPAFKKRAREDHDDGAGEQGSAKKVDVKDGDS